MLPITLGNPANPLTVLCLGAHSDDLEIGCAGTILTLAAARRIDVRWVVFGCYGERAAEATDSATTLLSGVPSKRIDVYQFRDGFFPYVGAEIKDVFERVKSEISPDLILAHTSHDRHQDHRLINELTWNTFRDHLIYEYEIPKYDGDLGSPNTFVRLSDEVVDRKIRHLMDAFPTQRSRRWYDEETFRGLMRLRGVECASRYAEAFYVRKTVL